MNPNTKILTFPGEYDNTIPNITLAEYIIGKIEAFGDEEACIDFETKKTLKFNQICEMTRALAAGFQLKYSLKAGDPVAIALPTCLEYPVAVLSVNLCGSVAILINPSQTTSELKHSIELSKPRLWISSESFAKGKFQEIYYPKPSDRPPMVIVSDKSSIGSSVVHWLDVLNLGRGRQVKIPVINSKADPAFILFSSGTTGVPKGVTLTNQNYITSRRQNVELAKNVPKDPNDMNVVMLPLYHAFGLSSILDNLVRGLRFVLIPHFTFRNMLEAIQRHRITILPLVPAIAAQLVKHPVEKQYDLSSLRLLFCGASALGKDLHDRLTEKFECMVFQGYGMTESTLRTHSNFIGYTKEGSVGVTMPFCESKIVNSETNEALGPNQEGEICVRGPLIMKGYIGNEKATKDMIDSDGWLRTGDVGYYDEEGFFFITDRVKELIKYKGLQVSPSELELLLLTHPDVMDAAIGSIPDEMAGELPRGYVVRKPESKITEDELIKFIAGQVSPHKQLRGGVVFVESIPKTATGKIIRRALKTLKSKL